MTRGGWTEIDGMPVHVCGDVTKMTDKDRAALGEMIRALKAKAKVGPVEVMTQAEASAEAVRRWGPTGCARIVGNARVVGTQPGVISVKTIWGRGSTWELAFAEADVMVCTKDVQIVPGKP